MISYDLSRIRAIIFDVDGVLSRQTITLSEDGEPLRTVNIKDGYAIQLAVKMGLKIAIMTGGNTRAVRIRYERLGVEDIFMGCAVKITTYEEFLQKHHLNDDEVMYCGDDIPDYEVMRRVGCPCAPADAAPEIKQIATYISHLAGGDGFGRDVVEQVLRAQGLWMSSAKAFGW